MDITHKPFAALLSLNPPEQPKIFPAAPQATRLPKLEALGEKKMYLHAHNIPNDASNDKNIEATSALNERTHVNATALFLCLINSLINYYLINQYIQAQINISMRTFLWLMRVLAYRHTYIHSYTARERSRDR
jgi:hypothetical protein